MLLRSHQNSNVPWIYIIKNLADYNKGLWPMHLEHKMEAHRKILLMDLEDLVLHLQETGQMI